MKTVIPIDRRLAATAALLLLLAVAFGNTSGAVPSSLCRKSGCPDGAAKVRS